MAFSQRQRRIALAMSLILTLAAVVGSARMKIPLPRWQP